MNAFMAYLPPKGRQDVVAGRVYRRFMEQGQFTFYQEPAWIYRFFAREYGPEQLFAIIFAAWWGFPRRDCARLSGLETGAAAWEELNGLLERQKKTLREERAVWDGEHPSRG